MIITDINNNQREAKSIVPDPNYPGFLKIEFLKRFDWYSVKEFVEKNPTLAYLVKQVRAIPDDTLGVVTDSTEVTLRDTKQNLKTDAYVGFIVWISRGLGEGQKRLVTGNTANTVTIDAAWDVKPDTTSQYVLSHNIHDVSAHGNSLPTVDQAKLEEESKKIDRLIKKGKTKQTKQVARKAKTSTRKMKPVKKSKKVAVKKRKNPTKKRSVVKKKKVVSKAVAKKRVTKNVPIRKAKTAKRPTKSRNVNKKKIAKKARKAKKK